MANPNDPPAPARPTVRPVVASASVAGALGSVGDPDGTRAVTSIVALLAVLGIGLVMLAVWLFRVTRPDPEVLAPLEVMGERKWRRADPVWQRRRLDEVRPDGAEPLQPERGTTRSRRGVRPRSRRHRFRRPAGRTRS